MRRTALLGAYVLYAGVARVTSRRAALLGALALWTMPGFALLSRQAMTDMPLTAGVAASLGLLLLALSTSDAVLAREHTVRVCGRELRLHAGHLTALAIAVVTLSQVVMLFLQHVHLDASGLHLRPDRLVSGSPHSCTLPGQPRCAVTALAHPKLAPGLQGALWLAPATWLVMRVAAERRIARLMALLAWACAAFATMAKGPAGLVIPAAATVVHLIAVRSLRPLVRLEIPAGLVLATAMIGPWYLAVYARHGRTFIDALVMRHMLGRTLDHLHDTNEGEDVGIVYFVRQLGYATFPWSGLGPLSVLASAQAPDRSGRARRGIARSLLFGATLVSFALVSAMRTKFHHYILVAVPPIAMLAGVQLDELLTIAKDPPGRRRAPHVAVMLLGAASLVALVGKDIAAGRGPAHFILLVSYRYTREWPSTGAFAVPFACVAIASAATVAAMVDARARKTATVALGGAALVSAGILMNVYLPRCAVDGGQREIIAAYYRARTPGDRSPLVAYQLNWKGENFYTGNHVAIFVSSGAPMKTYLDRRRTQGARTVHFVTERGRVRALQNELGAVESFTELTPPALSAEFTLVRAVL